MPLSSTFFTTPIFLIVEILHQRKRREKVAFCLNALCKPFIMNFSHFFEKFSLWKTLWNLGKTLNWQWFFHIFPQAFFLQKMQKNYGYFRLYTGYVPVFFCHFFCNFAEKVGAVSFPAFLFCDFLPRPSKSLCVFHNCLLFVFLSQKPARCMGFFVPFIKVYTLYKNILLFLEEYGSLICVVLSPVFRSKTGWQTR